MIDEKYLDLVKIHDEDKIASAYGMRIEHLDDKKCVVAMPIEENCRNYHGTLHGALYYAMADMSAGVLAHVGGGRHVTLSGSLNFLKAAADGIVRAVAEFDHRGRKTSVISLKIYDDKDVLLASGIYTYYCIGE